MTKKTKFEHIAFISYRHKPLDKKWAKWLSKSIETYRVPNDLVESGYQRRVGTCYRDEEEFNAAPDLSKAIETALLASKYLIVVCSKDTPKSKWIKDEIAFFKKHRDENNVLTLLIDGEPIEAFPPQLFKNNAGALIDPIAADVRSYSDLKPRTVNQLAFLRLTSRLIGCNFDDLRQREKIRQRVRRWQMGAAILALVTIFSGLISWNQTKLKLQSFEATQRALMDKSRLLIGSATSTSQDANFGSAINLILEGQNHDPIYRTNRQEGYAAISKQLQNLKEVLILNPQDHAIWTIGDFPKHGYVITAANNEEALLWNISEPNKPPLSLKGHTHGAKSASFSEEGDFVFTTSFGHELNKYNSSDGAKLSIGYSSTPPVKVLGISSGAELIFQVDERNNYAAVGLDTGESTSLEPLQVIERGFQHDLIDAVFSKDLSLVLAKSMTQVHIWNVESGKLLVSMPGDQAKFSPDGNIVATSFMDEPLRIWNQKSPSSYFKLTGHKSVINTFDFSPDSHVLAAGTTDWNVHFWDLNSLELEFSLTSHKSKIQSLIFSENEYSLLTSSTDGEIKLWDLSNFENEVTLRAHSSGVDRINYTNADHTVLSSSEDGTLRLWDIKPSILKHEINGDEGSRENFREVRFDTSGRKVILESTDDLLLRTLTVRVWDVDTNESIIIYQGPKNETQYKFTGSSDHLIAIPKNSAAILLDIKTGLKIKQLSQQATQNYLISNTLDIDNIEAGLPNEDAPGSNLNLVDILENKMGIKFLNNIEPSSVAVFNQDYTLFADAIAWSGEIGVWNTNTGGLIHVLNGHKKSINSIQFSRDNTNLLSSSNDGSARLWDIMTGSTVSTFRGHRGAVHSARFNPDESFVMTSSSDNTARIWDPITGIEMLTLSGHDQFVNQSDMSSDGHYLVTGALDNSAKLWALPYFLQSRRVKNAQLSKVEFEKLSHQDWTFAASAKVVPRCLTPDEREFHNLPADPPCWCQEKQYPTKKTWENDYKKRYPDLTAKPESWNIDDAGNVIAPNPFTYPRDDGWTCPVKGEGYSAPWAAFPDLKALSSQDILGPANAAYKKLDDLGIQR